MTQGQWVAVDEFISAAIVGQDPVLDKALEASDAAGLPQIAVAPTHGKFLNLLVSITGARSVLEIGTLGGYSSIWMARALPEDGTLVTLEYDPTHAEVARGNIAAAGLADKVEVLVGAASDTLPTLTGPYDLFFIDADKQSNPHYFAWAVEHSRPGSVIVVDNVVRGGGIVDDASTDPAIIGTRKLYEAIAAEPRVEATALQTVGVKGYDGFVVARVTG